MEVKPEDFRPESATFKLAATGDKEYTLNLFSVADRIWVKETLGIPMEEVFGLAQTDYAGMLNHLCRIAFRLLKDKSDFKMQTVTIVDENGHDAKEELGGWKLSRKLVCGPSEEALLVKSISKTLYGSQIPQEKKSEVAEMP